MDGIDVGGLLAAGYGDPGAGRMDVDVQRVAQSRTPNFLDPNFNFRDFQNQSAFEQAINPALFAGQDFVQVPRDYGYGLPGLGFLGGGVGAVAGDIPLAFDNTQPYTGLLGGMTPFNFGNGFLGSLF